MTNHKFNLFENPQYGGEQEAQWISLSDLMTSLMMVFLLIAVTFMMKVEADSAKAKRVAVIYHATRRDLYQDLYNEFKTDLPAWGAKINKEDLSISFNEPDVLFDRGKANLKPKFQEILRNFFPRYVKIITSEKYKNSIEEIRIEGHTSSIWNNLVTPEEAYFQNMDLSQLRTRTTLRFVLELASVQSNVDWLRRNMTANGLSSSRPVLRADKSENPEMSQRVEFRIRTDAEAKIATIVDSMK